MKLLIYGSKGWIGSQFVKYLLGDKTKTEFSLTNKEKLKDLIIYKGNSRLNDLESVEKEINNIKPDNIISFIGRTHGKIGDKEFTTIDYLEQEGKIYENIRDNLYSPISLALLCKELNIHYTYLGTGCIFDYVNPKNPIGFKESDKPNFFGSSYSIVKGFTDMLMHQLESNVLNLRIRMPINNENSPRNFIF